MQMVYSNYLFSGYEADIALVCQVQVTCSQSAEGGFEPDHLDGLLFFDPVVGLSFEQGLVLRCLV